MMTMMNRDMTSAHYIGIRNGFTPKLLLLDCFSLQVTYLSSLKGLEHPVQLFRPGPEHVRHDASQALQDPLLASKY